MGIKGKGTKLKSERIVSKSFRTSEEIMSIAVSKSGYIETDCTYLLLTGWDSKEGGRMLDDRLPSSVKILNPSVNRRIQGF